MMKFLRPLSWFSCVLVLGVCLAAGRTAAAQGERPVAVLWFGTFPDIGEPATLCTETKRAHVHATTTKSASLVSHATNLHNSTFVLAGMILILSSTLVLQYFCTIVFLYYSIFVLQYTSTIVRLYYSTFVLQYNCTIVSLYY